VALPPDAALLALLHLSDSLFPVGAFGHSDGLEAATASGRVRTAGDLEQWLDVCLDETIGRGDGPALCQAWSAFHDRRWPALAILDREVTALRPSSAARQSSRAIGLRLLTTWQRLHPGRGLEAVRELAFDGRIGPTLPVAFGCACASMPVEMSVAATAYSYTRLASTVSAAMRLMPIGQTDAHGALAAVLERVPAAVQRMRTRTALESFSPAMDIAMMSQQYLHSRLFRS
jgi:urease accessory protein